MAAGLGFCVAMVIREASGATKAKYSLGERVAALEIKVQILENKQEEKK